MRVQQIWNLVAVHLAVLSISEAVHQPEKPRLLQGETSSVYNFPFVCSYHYTPEKGESLVLGTCTIYTLGTVLFAVDTVDRLIGQTKKFWIQKIPQVTVIAGSDILDPEDPTSSNYVQVRKVTKFIVGLKEDMARHPTTATDPANFDDVNFERNALGELACDIGIFFLDKEWDWNPLVLPIPLATLNYETMTSLSQEWLDRLEYWPWLYDSCSIAGWGPTGNNELVVHELVYVPRDECLESICAHHGDACLYYPHYFHHVCFKSRNYGDVCVYDQGSPVFCPWFGRGVFAVLTRAFDCGLENMPAVYAIASYVTNFTKIALEDQQIEARPDFNDPKYVIPDMPPSTTTTKPSTKPTTKPSTKPSTKRRTTKRPTKKPSTKRRTTKRPTKKSRKNPEPPLY